MNIYVFLLSFSIKILHKRRCERWTYKNGSDRKILNLAIRAKVTYSGMRRFEAATAKLQANALVEVPLCRVQWLYPLTILPLLESATKGMHALALSEGILKKIELKNQRKCC